MKTQSIKFLSERLAPYGANVYNYHGAEFIAIKNPSSENHMAITFGEEEFSLEFTYQTARFKHENAEDGAIHAEKYLTEKLCAVEIFLSGSPIMGGSRECDVAKSKTVQEFAYLYAGGNEKVAENLLSFMQRGNVSVKIFSWLGTYDRAFEIIPTENGELAIKE